MLTDLITIMAFQLAGEVVTLISGLPLPGPLWGLLFLLGYLHVRGGPSNDLAAAGGLLIDHLGLLFVPAGAAIMSFAPLLLGDAAAIAAALVLSTCCGILVSGLLGGTIASKDSATALPEER
jgi:holin-like protein